MPGENFPGDRIVSLVDELEGLIERMMDGRYAPSKFALHAQTPFGHNGKRVN